MPLAPGTLDGLGGLDAGSLMALAMAAGFSPDKARIAAAIALAESGGNPGAYNPETAAKGGTPAGKGSYGLWQIYLKAHPEFEGVNLYDPSTNAAAAYAVSGGGANFRPWSTYNSGAYRSFLSSVSSEGTPTGDGGGLPEASADLPASPAFFGLTPLTLGALAVGAYFFLK